MTKLDKAMGTTRKLIDLPFNKFNLDNYEKILTKEYGYLDFIVHPNTPTQLMSGGHHNAGIINLSHKNYSKYSRKIYVIGKGILFDSGGLDLKRGMADMAGDKAGMIIALSVSHYLKGNVIAFCPVTTNLIQNSQITPGDELKIGKKIVKVTNTDAEGRLILAEAISTLNASKNDIIITIATLTGAVEYAIGQEATGVFGLNHDLLTKYSEASFDAKEMAWALPLWEYYQKKYYSKKLIENSIKDIKAGATEAAMFIKQFLPNPNNWLHLDIAGSAFNEEGKANGVPLKSLINFIRRLNV